ncbi:hypothetical protein GWN42_02435 [candidate division KSB1 bacterium]|nr:hypothetical protein [candidate division KSB1 bacterium]
MSSSKTKNKRKKVRKRNQDQAQRTSSDNKTDRVQENSWPIARNQKDDLQLIKGIGLTTENALNRIGVYRFTDFQEYSPDSLARALEEADLSVQATDIEKQNWLAHARELAKQFDEQPAVKGTNEALDESKTERKPEPKDAESDVRPEDEEKDVASANVQKETKHTEETKEETANETPEPTKNQETVHVPEEDKSEAKVSQKSSTVLKIKNVQLTPEKSPSQESVEQIRSSVNFEITGNDAKEFSSNGVPFSVQLHAANNSAGTVHFLGSLTARLRTNQLEYRLEFLSTVPQIGEYQLQFVAFLLQPSAIIDVYPGPNLKVVS